MRRKIMLTAFCLASACSGPDASSNAVTNMSTDAGVPDNGTEIADARAFVADHVEPHSGTITNKDGSDFNFHWELHGMSLGGARWNWREVSDEFSITQGVKFTATHDHAVSVDPSDLSLPVTVKKNGDGVQLVVECYSGKCVDVKGTDEIKLEPANMPNLGPTAALQSDGIYWPFDDPEKAQRVATALTVLLQSAGAKTRKF